MNWIYDLCVPNSLKSKKYQKAKSLLEETIGKHGPAYLFKELAQSISTDTNAQLGLLTIFEAHLLANIIDSQTINDQVVSGLVAFVVHLHNKLLRTNNRKKLIFSLKLFNKIMSRLPKEGKKVAGNSLKSYLEKKDLQNLNWALSVLGSKSGKINEEINSIRFKSLLANYFSEKPDPANPVVLSLDPIVFRSLTVEDFIKHLQEPFANLYKRNSANVPRVLEFYKQIGLGFFKRMQFEVLRECVHQKIFEALGNKADEIAFAAIETIKFFTNLGIPELNDLLIQGSHAALNSRNIESIKLKTLQICFALKLNNPATINTANTLLSNCLEVIKSDDIKANLVTLFFKEAAHLAKRIGHLDCLSTLLDIRGTDFNISMRLLIAKEVIEQKLTAENDNDQINALIDSVYVGFVKKTLIDNPNRLQVSNLETLVALCLVGTYNRITGRLMEHVKTIAKSFSGKGLEYFTSNFFKVNPPIFKTLLFESFLILDKHLEYPEKHFDIVLGALASQPDLNTHKILTKFKPSQQFVLATVRGSRMLTDWLDAKPNLGPFWSHSIDQSLLGIDLDVMDAHYVIDSISKQDPKLHLTEAFNKAIVKHNKFSVLRSVLTYPTDMKNPIDHHYLGQHGLFSLWQDKQNYYLSYTSIQFTLDLNIFFKNSEVFYRENELEDLRLLQSRNSMVYRRDLEIIDNHKETYRDILEHLEFIKREKKTNKKKNETAAPEIREVPIDYKLTGDLELKLLKPEAAYKEFAFYLKRISDSAAECFNAILHTDSNHNLALMDLLKSSNIFDKLKLILKRDVSFGESLRKLVSVILNGLIHKVSSGDFADKFASVYYDVISSQRAVQLTRQLEESLASLYQIRDDTSLHPAAIPIISDFCQFCFENLYDAEARRKAFDILQVFAIREKSHFMYNFIKDHLDDLYFKDTQETLIKEIENLGAQDSSLLSGLLLKILDYQDKAQKTFLNTILTLTEEQLKRQVVGNFERIKLIILTKGENKQTAELTEKVLERVGGKLEFNHLIELDFLRMVKEIPFDLHTVTGEILSEALQNKSKEQKLSFFKKMLENCSKHVQERTQRVKEYEEKPDDKSKFIDIDEVEETLAIYPVILSCLAASWEESALEELFDVLIRLESNHLPKLTEKICNVGITFINVHKAHASQLVNIIEARIKQKEGIISPLVFLGAVAKHLTKKQINIDQISSKILALTESPDMVFQNKLGKYISRLLVFFEDPAEVIQDLIRRTLEEKEPFRIRARCYSIAGLVRGQGVGFLERYDIISKIIAIVRSSDKKDLKDVPKHHKYYIVYMLSATMEYFGRIFEPRFPEVLPCLMKLFGDGTEEIRDLSTQVLNIAMKRLSGFGVKKILPILIEGCNDSNSRTKLSNLAALGSIAYCASKQLASCLPEIVPKLTVATIDTNPNIKEAAIKSLNQLLSTIKTPEIVDIRETLINALSRPYDENGRALEILLNTQFNHLLDSSSVALVIPIITYGLKNHRENKQREDAAKVVANISQLIKDPEDLVVYVPALTEGLIQALSDILPEVRATAAKATGKLTGKLRVENSDHMIQALRKVIETESTPSIERAGCAQALCEALFSFGLDHVENNFRTIYQGAMDKREHIREGFLSMLVYLPVILDDKFERYIQDALAGAVDSIAHTNENIRNLAVKIIKTIIQKYSENHMDQILKSLFDGMFSDSHLKRNSSVELIGHVIDVLFKDNEKSKDQIFNENASIFSALYIVKNDENSEVKIATSNIWTAFVENTKKVLKNIYPILTRNLIDLLISGAKYHDEIARLTISVYIGKYGDIFIDDIIKLLKLEVSKNNPKFNTGVCNFLKETFLNFNPEHLKEDRRNNFEALILLLLSSSEESVWAASIDTIFEYFRLCKHDEYIREALQGYREELNSQAFGDQEAEYEKRIRIFILIAKLNISKLNHFIEDILFTDHLMPWQLDIISNTAQIFGSKMYTKGKLKTGLTFFADQYVEHYKGSDRGALMLYTIKNLVESLTPSHEGLFVTQNIEFIKRYIAHPKENFCLVMLSMQVLRQFYEYNCQGQTSYLTVLMDNIVPLLCDKTENSKEIFENLGLFLKTKLSVLTRHECAMQIETIYHSLNRLKAEEQDPVGLAYSEIFDPLFFVISSAVIFGDKKVCSLGLDCLDIFIKVMQIGKLQEYSNKVIGVLIRVINYKHEELLKAKLMSKLALVIGRIELDSAQEAQICTLIVQLFNEKHEDQSYISQLELLTATLTSRTQDKLLVVRRWAKRCICDERFTTGKLLTFINNDSIISHLATKVQELIDKRNVAGITTLAL